MKERFESCTVKLRTNFGNTNYCKIPQNQLPTNSVIPEHGYYKKFGKHYYESTYHAALSSYQNVSWQTDEAWQRLICRDNIERAWARARTGLLREPLVDEAEIRLIDQQATKFIDELRLRLITYSNQLFHPADQIYYALPKNLDSFRPMSLSRFEEEILSIALIQVLGDEYASHRKLNAFRLNPRIEEKSEFLYSYFGGGYSDWQKSARDAAMRCSEGKVIKTDITSFYTSISQNCLADTILLEASVESERVRWLLEKVLSKYLDPEYHTRGFGLAQGGVGSGYYANAYLATVDNFFLSENPFGVSYHQFADDMIIVVPNRELVHDVIDRLDVLLGGLRSQTK